MDDEIAHFVNDVRDSPFKRSIFRTLANGGVDDGTLREQVEADKEAIQSLLERAIELGLVETRENRTVALTEPGERAIEFVLQDDWNPSSLDTKKGRTFEVLSDCKWHCAECELYGSQVAAYIRDFGDEGFEFISKSGRGATDRRRCDECGEKTTHRKLKYPFPSDKPITRQEMPDSFKRRVRKLYDQEDAYSQSEPGTTPEVDHRKPRVRWDEPEDFDYDEMTDDEIRENFQILSGKHNLLKSRKCEQCVETGKRPAFFGIEFYYEGGEQYEEDIGCEGCGWYNPHEWRAHLDEIIQKSELTE